MLISIENFYVNQRGQPKPDLYEKVITNTKVFLRRVQLPPKS